MNYKTGNKGYETEELVRTYFIRAGFYVSRGIRVQAHGDDLTDVDLWLYERSATLARRRIIIDIKDKRTPQAAERLFFIKGLADALRVEGAGVVTTDSRPSIRDFAHKNGVIWIDGNDLARLKNRSETFSPDRISEEELSTLIMSADSARRSKFFRDGLEKVKASIVDRFGSACANTALEGAKAFVHGSVSGYPDSPTSRLAARLAYLTISIAAVAFDFVSADTALRPPADRIKYFTRTIRYGDDAEGTLQNIRWAVSAIQDYIPNGANLAQMMKANLEKDLNSIPAENFAEIVEKLTRTGDMFSIARNLEAAAYSKILPTFDQLNIEEKSFIGACLDFFGISRESFAKSWKNDSYNNKNIARLDDAKEISGNSSVIPKDIPYKDN